jgi:hypothetical protein
MNIWCKVSVIAAAALAAGSYGMTHAAAQGSLAPPAQSAPSPEALQAARELTSVISVSMVTDLAQTLTSQVWPDMEAALRRQNPNINAAALADLRRELERQQAANVIESMNDAVAIYARHFTVEEMRALAAFHRTPAGMKALTVMPRVTAELVVAMAPRLQASQKRITEAVMKLLETNAAGPAPAQPAAAK